MANEKQNLSERDLNEVAGGWHTETNPNDGRVYLVSDTTVADYRGEGRNNYLETTLEVLTHYYGEPAGHPYRAVNAEIRADGRLQMILFDNYTDQQATHTYQALGYMMDHFSDGTVSF